MKKVNGIILGTFITATLFSVFGQDLAYFMNENFFKTYPIYYLTAFTVLSIFLYAVSFGTTFAANKMQKYKTDFEYYFMVIALVGLPASLWSVFVLAMWWG